MLYPVCHGWKDHSSAFSLIRCSAWWLCKSGQGDITYMILIIVSITSIFCVTLPKSDILRCFTQKWKYIFQKWIRKTLWRKVYGHINVTQIYDCSTSNSGIWSSAVGSSTSCLDPTVEDWSHSASRAEVSLTRSGLLLFNVIALGPPLEIEKPWFMEHMKLAILCGHCCVSTWLCKMLLSCSIRFA